MNVALMPPKREQQRLDVVYHIMVRMMGGRLWLAPVDEDKVQYALDIGTGTGSHMWLLFTP